VVDRYPALLKELQQRLDIRTVIGHASHPDVLYRAGIEDADLIFAVTNDDEINMIACQVAYSLFQTPTRLARVRSSDYSNQPGLFRPSAMPVNYLINPEQLVTRNIQRLIDRPGAFEVLEFADGRIQLAAVRVEHDGPLVAKGLSELDRWIASSRCRIVAVFRGGKSFAPDHDYRVRSGDEIYFVAERRNVRTVLSAFCDVERTNRKIMIAGGGNLGLGLAQLIEADHNVKLIERDPERCRHLAGSLRRTIVLNGDATDPELLQAEGIDATDVFCATTNEDKTNVISAMLAKRLKARKTLSIVNDAAHADLAEGSMVDVVVSPAQVTIGALLTHIRRGDIVVVHSLRRGSAEAIEIVAHGDRSTSHVVGRRIQDLPLGEGVSICAIVRQNRILFPDPEQEIESQDRVVVFLADKQQVSNVELLFQVAITFV
jgi:trk system potassium uptake protein TrkA